MPNDATKSNPTYLKCILCEKMNTLVYFGICIICHMKIDDSMGNISSSYLVKKN